jgi:hypothetical protein
MKLRRLLMVALVCVQAQLFLAQGGPLGTILDTSRKLHFQLRRNPLDNISAMDWV